MKENKRVDYAIGRGFKNVQAFHLFFKREGVLNDGFGGNQYLTVWDENSVVPYNYTVIDVALPVNLLNFKAYSENQIAHLSWETTEETNNESFEIQRSANAIDFVTIGQLKGNGTTNVEKSYKFTDISPINGLNYYRLKQNDRDGKFEFSKIISLKINTLNDSQVITFPNPSNNGFRISNLMIGNRVSGCQISKITNIF